MVESTGLLNQRRVNSSTRGSNPRLSAKLRSRFALSFVWLRRPGGISDMAELRHVYILESLRRPEKQYVGLTYDIDRRLQEHNAGSQIYSRRYAPCDGQFLHAV